MQDLKQAVLDKIAELGPDEAAKFFSAPPSTIAKWKEGVQTPTLKAAQLVLVDSPKPAVDSVLAMPFTHIAHWEGRKVMLLLPSYKTINPLTHFTLFANYARYGAEKLSFGMKNMTVIHEARSFLIHIGMMDPAIEDFIMFDDDMILPTGNEQHFNGNFRMGVKPESARFNAISRLMSHDRNLGVIGGLYYGRHEFGMPQCDWGFNQNRGTLSNELRAERHQGLIPMPWVATGALRIPRWVIEKKKEAIDGGRWPELKPTLQGGYYGYFHPKAAGFGEDMSFGYRLEETGIKSYLDASLVIGHADGNAIYGPKNTRNKGINDQ